MEQLKATIIDSFDKNLSLISEGEPEYLVNMRKKAYTSFVDSEIFSKDLPAFFRHEDYIHKFLEKTYALLYNYPKSDLQVSNTCPIVGLKTISCRLHNGLYFEKDDYTVLGNGVIIGNLKYILSHKPELAVSLFNRLASEKSGGFFEVNTALFTSGIFVHVPDNVEVELPIQILNGIDYHQEIFMQTRNLISVGKNSKVSFIHCDDSYNDQHSFSNNITEVYVGENSRVDYYKLQQLNNAVMLMNSIFFHLEANACLNTYGVDLHGGMLRNNYYVQLNGENCDANIHGLYLADKQQCVGNYVKVEHLKPNSKSNQIFKGILDDSAKGVFYGHIVVHEHAHHTQAYQSNKNILLTNKAIIKTEPFLEIYNDDVKCSHGATVGQLDPQALFYIKSRGISEKGARALLMYAFCHEIISKMSIETLRVHLEDIIKQRLHGDFETCDQCVFSCKNIDFKKIEIDYTKL